MKNTFDLKKFLVENKLTANSATINEVKFGKKEIIHTVSFPNGTTYTIGDYTNYDSMIATAINPVPEDEREEDEIVAIEMKDGEDGIVVYFNANGEQVEI